MIEEENSSRDLRSLVVPRAGSLAATGDPWEPYRLLDSTGEPVTAVAAYFGELQAAGRAAATQRSYGMALLRWFRFLWAIEIAWREATRIEARDFSRWIQIGAKPVRPHWRAPDKPVVVKPKRVNAVTGKRPPGEKYAPSTIAHCETVLRSFYDFHLDAGTGPLVNPFPLARAKRAHAHHNPMDRFGPQRAGLYRPRQPKRIPRHIPDAVFNDLFARLSSDRDRALVAFWVSTGARAAELLGVLRSGADPGQQLITVVRKGSRAMQQLPASPDAFVWLRLYQQQIHGLAPAGPDDPLWWTLRKPFRPLTYHAAGRCSSEPTRSWGRTGRCTTCDTRRPTVWPATRACRSPTSSGFSVMLRYHHPDLYDSDPRGRHRRGDRPSPASSRAPAARGTRVAGLSQGEPGRVVRPEGLVTTTAASQQTPRTWQVSSEAQALLKKFPPRLVPGAWPRTRESRVVLEYRMAAAPFRGDDSQSRCHRNASLQAVLDWLELYPGQSWQQRWEATAVGHDGRRDWRLQMLADLAAAGLLDRHPGYVRKILGTGLIQLIGGDYLRPSLGWLMATTSPLRIANEMAKVRDPEGIAELRTARLAGTVGDSTMIPAIEKIDRARHGREGRLAPQRDDRRLPRADEGQQGGLPRTDPIRPTQPGLLSTAALDRPVPLGRPTHGPHVQPGVRRPSPGRATRRPVSGGLSPGPRPAGRLPT